MLEIYTQCRGQVNYSRHGNETRPYSHGEQFLYEERRLLLGNLLSGENGRPLLSEQHLSKFEPFECTYTLLPWLANVLCRFSASEV